LRDPSLEKPLSLACGSAWLARPVAILLCVQLGALTQTQETATLTFRLKGKVPVLGQRNVPLQIPAQCDTRGNVYVQAYTSATARPLPILKISPEGKVLAILSPPSLQDMPEAGFDPFAVTAHGRVYWVASTPKETRLVELDEEGHFVSSVRVEKLVAPRQLAVFASGEFLVSGYRRAELADVDEPLTALFDRTGRFIKEVELPDDIRLEPDESSNAREQSPAPDGSGSDSQAYNALQQASPDQPRPDNPAEDEPVSLQLKPKEFSRAIDLSTAVSADDGNIYLMRPTSPPIIYVIAPSGSLLRRLVITAPGPGFLPSEMKVAAGRVLVSFGAPNPTRRGKQFKFVMGNAGTGETIAHYVTGPKTAGPLACYTAEGVTFVSGMAGGGMALDIVHPR
jgi:hypothetical protein